VLGEASAHETFTGRGTHWMGSKTPRTGVQDDQAENRVKDMEDEGADAHFMVPTLWVSVVGLPDVELEVGLIRAYHRHAEEFCGQFPMRLKTAIVASTRHVDEAVREITRWGSSKWAAAVLPVFGKDIPVDHPDLEPIWTVAQESADCAPQQHVESTVTSPATRIYGTTSSWAGSRRTPGAGCGSWPPSSGPGSWIATRGCAWGSSNAASAGSPSGQSA
jgi:hypothetical protein